MAKTMERTLIKVSNEHMPVPATEVSVYEALYRRRTVWQFRSAPVPQEAIERLLEAAVWAPNHRMTEPWRFFVLERDTPIRRQVAGLAYECAFEKTGSRLQADVARRKVLEPPMVLYVYSIAGSSEEITRENYAAVCCAIQNMCLAAVAEGLAVGWGTGGAARHPQLAATLGAEEDWVLAGMLAIGSPLTRARSSRSPASRFWRWYREETPQE